MGLFSKIKDIATYSPLGIGGGSGLFGDGGSGAMNANIAQQKEYAKKLEEAYGGNADALKGLMSQIQANNDNYNINVDQAVNSSNKNFAKTRNQQNSDLINMGLTPSSSKAFANVNAALNSEQASMEEQIRNNANQAKYNANQGTLGSLANLTNQMYNNQLGALGGASNALNNAYNAQSAAGQAKLNQGMGLLGSLTGLIGGFL